ncbi:hypothetical protein [Nocardia brasiliensis]|uniref:hypothetical protein n=1 Tax=Nocardia brasiliensis TaxID=37326 RepID=UPI003D8E2C31
MPDISTVQPAINAAMNSATPDEIIAGVKSIVASEIEKLSPDVRIEYTDYFNHTYMPDMVLSWGGRRVEQRPIFLRNSLRLEPTLGDVRGLEDREPVVLGLKPVDPEVGSQVRESLDRRRRVFVTDVSSIGIAGRNASGSSPANAPLLGIVRNSILRSGRGMMTTSDATDLVTAAEGVVAADRISAEAALGRLEMLTESLLAEDGAYQVSRAGRLLQAVQTPELLAEFTTSASGRLSEADLGILLPYLFSHTLGFDLPGQFWRTLAELVHLEDLEVLPAVEDMDISLLAGQAAGKWTTSRAELVLNNEFDSGDDRTTTRWYMRAGKLHAIIGPWKIVFVSDDNRRLKGATDSREASWDQISNIARHMIVESATLRGIVRRLTIDAEQSSNVVQDIEHVTSTLDDTYRVQQLIVRLADSDGFPVEVDFKKMLTTVRGGSVSVAEIGAITLLLLGHRNPVSPSWTKFGVAKIDPKRIW